MVKEEDKVDEQYDMGYVIVKLVLFLYIGCLIYKRFFEVCFMLWMVFILRYNRIKWLIFCYVKKC